MHHFPLDTARRRVPVQTCEVDEGHGFESTCCGFLRVRQLISAVFPRNHCQVLNGGGETRTRFLPRILGRKGFGSFNHDLEAVVSRLPTVLICNANQSVVCQSKTGRRDNGSVNAAWKTK